MRMYGPTGVTLVIRSLPRARERHGPLVLVDLPVDVIIVLEQQERADQLQRPHETRRHFEFA
jgi:hypothetical protein